jgi:hypothetical protein
VPLPIRPGVASRVYLDGRRVHDYSPIGRCCGSSRRRGAAAGLGAVLVGLWFANLEVYRALQFVITPWLL